MTGQQQGLWHDLLAASQPSAHQLLGWSSLGPVSSQSTTTPAQLLSWPQSCCPLPTVESLLLGRVPLYLTAPLPLPSTPGCHQGLPVTPAYSAAVAHARRPCSILGARLLQPPSALLHILHTVPSPLLGWGGLLSLGLSMGQGCSLLSEPLAAGPLLSLYLKPILSPFLRAH